MPKSYGKDATAKVKSDDGFDLGIAGPIIGIAILSVAIALLGASIWLNQYIWFNVFTF